MERTRGDYARLRQDVGSGALDFVSSRFSVPTAARHTVNAALRRSIGEAYSAFVGQINQLPADEYGLALYALDRTVSPNQPTGTITFNLQTSPFCTSRSKHQRVHNTARKLVTHINEYVQEVAEYCPQELRQLAGPGRTTSSSTRARTASRGRGRATSARSPGHRHMHEYVDAEHTQVDPQGYFADPGHVREHGGRAPQRRHDGHEGVHERPGHGDVPAGPARARAVSSGGRQESRGPRRQQEDLLVDGHEEQAAAHSREAAAHARWPSAARPGARTPSPGASRKPHKLRTRHGESGAYHPGDRDIFGQLMRSPAHYRVSAYYDHVRPAYQPSGPAPPLAEQPALKHLGLGASSTHQPRMRSAPVHHSPGPHAAGGMVSLDASQLAAQQVAQALQQGDLLGAAQSPTPAEAQRVKDVLLVGTAHEGQGASVTLTGEPTTAVPTAAAPAAGAAAAVAAATAAAARPPSDSYPYRAPNAPPPATPGVHRDLLANFTAEQLLSAIATVKGQPHAGSGHHSSRTPSPHGRSQSHSHSQGVHADAAAHVTSGTALRVKGVEGPVGGRSKRVVRYSSPIDDGWTLGAVYAPADAGSSPAVPSATAALLAQQQAWAQQVGTLGAWPGHTHAVPVGGRSRRL